MNKPIDQLTKLLEHNNIFLHQGAKMYDVGEKTEEYERFHSLKVGLTPSKAYLIDSGASNHMVSSRESFTTLTLSGGPSIDRGCVFQIPTTGRGSIKI